MFIQTQVTQQIWGNGESILYCGNATTSSRLLRPLRGQAQCVYIDPPFMTGKQFSRRRPYGKKGWKTGSPAPLYASYADGDMDEKTYLRLLRKLIVTGRDLLKDSGIFCLHLDWRMSARGRVLCDSIFGPACFMNEIIWGYESGGRAVHTFSRKHDTILLYGRTQDYRFDIKKVPLERSAVRHNHMARGMDEDGRTYGYIRSGGKEYRYYDDEPVYPGDVWTDIGFLQQRDPERTGFATQKPLKLLDRLLKPVVEPGDLVVDLCCGSGTACEAAQLLGCRFVGIDLMPEAIAIASERLRPDQLRIVSPTLMDGVQLLGTYDRDVGRLRLQGLDYVHDAFPEKHTPEDTLEAWDTGVIRNGVFISDTSHRRSFRYPELTMSLELPEEAIPAVMTLDAAGNRRAYRWEKD